MRVERNDLGDVNYKQFIQLLNWRDSPGETIVCDEKTFSPCRIFLALTYGSIFNPYSFLLESF